MGGESWCTINDHQTPFPVLKTGHVDHLLVRIYVLIFLRCDRCVLFFIITEVYDKRDNFNFNIVNYPFICSNIPARPTYVVYISQLIRINRICDNFNTFVKRHRLFTERLIRQGFWYNKLRNSFKKFAKRYNAELSKYIYKEGICNH